MHHLRRMAWPVFPDEEDTWIIIRNYEIHEGAPLDTGFAAAPNRGGRAFAGTESSGQNRFDLSEGPKIGDQFAVEWANITDPKVTDKRTRTQAHQRGWAIFSRGEGAWFDGSSVYLCSTDGGPRGGGQLYRLNITKAG